MWIAAVHGRCVVILGLLCAVSTSTSVLGRGYGALASQPGPKRSSGAVNVTRFAKPWTVCTSHWTPMVSCDGLEPPDFDGYQIALWRAIADELGLTETQDWSFVCLPWDDMIADLADDGGYCTVAAAGVEVSVVNVVVNQLQFSWPFYKSGLQVMISSYVDKPGRWSFFAVFHWHVWAILVASAMGVMLIVNLVEVFSTGGLSKLQSNSANRKGLHNWSWYISGQLVNFQTHVGDPKTWGSKVLVMGWAFMVLILVHLFTGQTAYKITSERLANTISGPYDLPGKKVESWGPYLPLLKRYKIWADAVPWENSEDERIMVEKLRKHEYQALILDQPVIQGLAAAAAPNCDLFPVGDIFETFDLAIAYPRLVPKDLAGNVSAAQLTLQTKLGIMDQLERQYLQGAADKGDVCPNAFINNADPSASGGGDLKQIQLSEVAGLWILLGGAVALAIPLTLYQRWSFRKGGATLRVYDSFLRRSVVGVLEGDSFKEVEEVAPQVGSAPSFSMDNSGLAKNTFSPRRVLDHKPSKLGDAQAAKLMVIAEADNQSEAGSEGNEIVSDPRGAEIVSDPRGGAQLMSDGGGKEAAQSQQHRKSQETDLNQVLELTSIDGDKPS